MLSTIELINTGILMGIVHVLTGPDHLSALATLSGTNISSHEHLGSSFFLGIKWGLGHSLGLLIVGGLLIWMEEEANEEWMSVERSMIFEWFVGAFMLLLGIYGLHKAFRNKKESAILLADVTETPRESLIEDSDEEDPVMTGKRLEMPKGNRRASMEIIEQMAAALNRDGDSIRGSGSVEGGPPPGMDDMEARIFHAAESLRENSGEPNENDRDDEEEQFMKTLKRSAKGALSKSFVHLLTNDRPTPRASQFVHKVAAPENSIALDVSSRSASSNHSYSRCGSCFCVTPGLLAIIAGIVHGIAGPGGVLGVIPAVQLRDPKLACVYLSTFCVTSTLVMGGFAAFYGKFSSWLAAGGGGNTRQAVGGRVFVVEVGSAFLSIAVGVVWLVLLSIGKLQDLF